MAALTGVGAKELLRFDTSDQTGNLRRQIALAKAAIPDLVEKSLGELAGQLGAIGSLVIAGEVTDASLSEELGEIKSLVTLRLPVIEIANRLLLLKQTGIHSEEEQRACSDMVSQLLDLRGDDSWGDFRGSLISQLTELSDQYTATIAKKLAEAKEMERVRRGIQEALESSSVSGGLSADQRVHAAARPTASSQEAAVQEAAIQRVLDTSIPAERAPSKQSPQGVQRYESNLIQEADRLYRSHLYQAALTLLEKADFPEALCLKGRAHTKLKQFEEAKSAFERALDKPGLSSFQRHFYLHRRAQMWLTVWKETGCGSDLEGCAANLNASLLHGSSSYPALIALEVARIPRSSIRLMPDTVVKSAVIFFEDGRSDYAFEMLCKYPDQKDKRAGAIAQLLKENKIFDAVVQLCKEPITTPLRAALLAEGLRHDKRRMEEEEVRSDFHDISDNLCNRAYESGMLFLNQGVYLRLSKRLLSRAWVLQRHVDTKTERWIEINTRYAATLVQLHEFDALQKWSSSWPLFLQNGASSGKAASLYNLIRGFSSHYQIGKTVSHNVYAEPPPPTMKGFQEAKDRGDRLVKHSFLVTGDYVKGLLEEGREHFAVAAQDPCWKQVLDHYFR